MPNQYASAVLQVLPTLDTGGVEQGTIEIAQALVRDGFGALVASTGGRLVPVLQAAGGQHFTLPLAAKDPMSIVRNAGKLARLARAEGAGLLHARSRAPAWSALLAARRAGLPFITTYHGVYREEVPGKRLYNSVMARGDRVIAASRYVAGLIAARHGTDPARIRLIPRGVDPAHFNPNASRSAQIAQIASTLRLPVGAPVVVLPARLTRWKGGLVLVEALARLARRDAVAVFVGSDQGRTGFAAELEQRARALGIADRVRLAGHCADMPAALTLADVVVSASTEPEGFGRAVIEAQAMARPVIATDHGGAAETIEEGETGYLGTARRPGGARGGTGSRAGAAAGGPPRPRCTGANGRHCALYGGCHASRDARRLSRAAVRRRSADQAERRSGPTILSAVARPATSRLVGLESSTTPPDITAAARLIE